MSGSPANAVGSASGRYEADNECFQLPVMGFLCMIDEPTGDFLCQDSCRAFLHRTVSAVRARTVTGHLDTHQSTKRSTSGAGWWNFPEYRRMTSRRTEDRDEVDVAPRARPKGSSSPAGRKLCFVFRVPDHELTLRSVWGFFTIDRQDFLARCTVGGVAASKGTLGHRQLPHMATLENPATEPSSGKRLRSDMELSSRRGTLPEPHRSVFGHVGRARRAVDILVQITF